jgi:hypothetical protein
VRKPVNGGKTGKNPGDPESSATGHGQRPFRQPFACYWNLRDCVVDQGEVFRSEFDRCRSDVFFEPMKLGRSGDWNDPRFLSKVNVSAATGPYGT